MGNFILKKIDANRLLLLCLTHNSVMAYLDDILCCDEIKNNDGILIIDQLLVVGDGKNRFLCCYFSNGNIEIEQSKVIAREDNFIFRKISSELLESVSKHLEYSILTERQRELISEKGII